jgi:hypothetical protein
MNRSLKEVSVSMGTLDRNILQEDIEMVIVNLQTTSIPLQREAAHSTIQIFKTTWQKQMI